MFYMNQKEYKHNYYIKNKEYKHQYYLTHKEQYKRANDRRRKENAEKIAIYQKEYNKIYRIEHHDKWNKSTALSQRKYRQKIKIELIEMLGGKCSNTKCLVPNGCKDYRCLQIDHINGGGLKHVKSFSSHIMFYVYYAHHPDEAKQLLQVLCANCNWIKRFEKLEHKKRKY